MKVAILFAMVAACTAAPAHPLTYTAAAASSAVPITYSAPQAFIPTKYGSSKVVVESEFAPKTYSASSFARGEYFGGVPGTYVAKTGGAPAVAYTGAQPAAITYSATPQFTFAAHPTAFQYAAQPAAIQYSAQPIAQVATVAQFPKSVQQNEGARQVVF